MIKPKSIEERSGRTEQKTVSNRKLLGRGEHELVK
jgi:hypothetical protein